MTILEEVIAFLAILFLLSVAMWSMSSAVGFTLGMM